MKSICLKRQSGMWYVKSHAFTTVNGRIEHTVFWAPAGTLDRAIMMAGGH